ncbi:hypothetical protein FEDK69T_13060 [Flavobacterium enshiense DK69]|nr:hypothetical protein FEDK69T_13060 [Flavobacterium enshiense DK69]
MNQTHADFEHIIIDDGSTDDTENVVRGFNDDRIHYYKYEKNDKRSFLRNEGFRKAEGNAISLLDSDDIWANDKLETIKTVFSNNPDVSFVIHNVAFIPDDAIKEDLFSNYKSDYSGNILSDVLDDTILPFSTFTIKKDALGQIGYLDESMIDGQHDLYVRATSKFKAYYCARKLTYIRKHSQNISKKTNMSHYDDYMKTIGKLENQGSISHKKHRILKSKIYSKIAYIYQKQEQYNDAKESYRKAFQARFFSYNGLKSFYMFLKLHSCKSADLT